MKTTSIWGEVVDADRYHIASNDPALNQFLARETEAYDALVKSVWRKVFKGVNLSHPIDSVDGHACATIDYPELAKKARERTSKELISWNEERRSAILAAWMAAYRRS